MYSLYSMKAFGSPWKWTDLGGLRVFGLSLGDGCSLRDWVLALDLSRLKGAFDGEFFDGPAGCPKIAGMLKLSVTD